MPAYLYAVGATLAFCLWCRGRGRLSAMGET